LRASRPHPGHHPGWAAWPVSDVVRNARRRMVTQRRKIWNPPKGPERRPARGADAALDQQRGGPSRGVLIWRSTLAPPRRRQFRVCGLVARQIAAAVVNIET
jgi:hypothetical protein